MCGVSNLLGNLFYITPIMFSCPIKNPEHVVQEAKAWTWHSNYSEFSRQHLCKASSVCIPERLGGRGLGYLCMTAHMQEIFLLVPTYSFPPAASELRPVWFDSSYFDSTLYVFFTSPVRLHVVCSAEWCIIYYVHAETVFSRRTLKKIHCLSHFQFGEVNVIVFVTQDSCWKVKDRWTEWL
jgi:hypothetical protein